MRAVREMEGIDRERFREEIVPDARPLVLRGIARDWPAVCASNKPGGCQSYLTRLDSGASCDMLVGAPEHGGRIFYDGPEMRGLNFVREPTSLSAAIARLDAVATMAEAPTLALQSVAAARCAPRFAEDNRLELIDPSVGPRLWIGNRVVVATHQDMFDNVAVVVAGRRRFTLFPPSQVSNLYVGPFEFTPNGTPVSLVDLDEPDAGRFPRFAEAMEEAEQTELAAGDAIFIPYMWWHHVRSLDLFGVLANYWWNDAPAPQPGLAPVDALVHALLALRDLPAGQRRAWRDTFAAMVFGEEESHIPEARRGIRGKLSPEAGMRLRRQLGALMSR